MQYPIVAPVVALVAWSMIMMIWLYAARIPAMARKGISLKGRVGSKGSDLDGVVDPNAQWKAHNYNHLMEQPTLFYAVCFALALLEGGGVWINVWLAWAYVALRIAHSLVQVTVNVVLYRFLLFALSSVALIGLVVQAIRMLCTHV